MPLPCEKCTVRTLGWQITYLELLRDSIFTLSPPGDLWEAYRVRRTHCTRQLL